MASPSPSPSRSPPHAHPLPVSKRDKRRTTLSDKYSMLENSLDRPSNPRDRDDHFRTQLASLQVDMQMITRADISGRNMNLMDTSADAIYREVDDTMHAMGLEMYAPGRGRENSVMAGKWYMNFLEQVNDAMEDRDTQLTLLHNQHRTKAASLAAQHTRALIHAREEHKALASTIQQRLQARLKATLKKLATEKESSSNSANALSSLSSLGSLGDISESNALHHHPSNYGLVAGIGSPRRHGDSYLADDGDIDKEASGSRRKPRRRAGEVAELLAFGVGMNFDLPSANGKRKRNRAQTSDEHAEVATPPAADEPNSPALTAALDPADEEGNRRRREEIFKQIYPPVFHIDKLFSDKELQLHGNQATLASLRYFQDKAAAQESLENGNGDNGEHAQNHDDSSNNNNHNTPTAATTPVQPPSVDDSGDPHDDPAANNNNHHHNNNNHNSSNADRDRLSPLSEITRGLGQVPSYNPPGVSTRSNPPRHAATTTTAAAAAAASTSSTAMTVTSLAAAAAAAAADSKELDSLVASGIQPVGMSYVNKAGIAPPPPPLRPEHAEDELRALRKRIVEIGGKRREDGFVPGPAVVGAAAGGKKVRRN